VDPAADSPIPLARAAELRLECGQGPFLEVGAGEDSEPLHLARGHRADAVEARDGKRSNELRPTLRGDHRQAVRFAMIRGELGDELEIRNARRGREPGFLADSPPDVLSDGARGA